MRLGAVILLFTLLSTFAASALVGLGRLSVIVTMRAVNGTLVSAAAVTTVALGGGIDNVLLMQLIVAAFKLGVLVIAVAATQRGWIVPRIHRPTFAAMARFSGFIFVAGMAYQLMLQGPPTVLAGHAGTAELATYAVPAIVLQQLTLLASSASLGFMPLASAESADDDRTRLTAIFRSHMRLTMLVMGPVAAYLAVFAEPLLSTWIDADFAAQAADPLRFLAGAGLMVALSAPAADVARGLGRPGWVLVYTVSAGAVAILAGLVFVEPHGAAGVAGALCLSLTITTIPLVAFVARRLLTLESKLLAAALAPALLAAVSATVLYGLGGIIIDGFTGALVTGAMVTTGYLMRHVSPCPR